MLSKRVPLKNLSILTISLALLLAASISIPNSLTLAYALPHMAAAGDWDCSSNTDQTVKSIRNHGATLTLGLGDYSYGSTETCWFNKVDSIDDDNDVTTSTRTIKINIGNHDDESDSKLTSLKNHFGFGSNLYYSFNIQNVHVLVLNTESSSITSTSSSQYNFIKNDLAAARSNTNIKWIIVSLHKPFFSSPNSCSSSTCHGWKDLVKAIEPLLDKNKVDLVLEGHVHNYQRTYPLKFNSNDPLNPTRTTNIVNDYTNPSGRIYALVGTGGVNFHTLTGKASFVAYQQGSKFGQLDITISNDGTYNILSGKFCANDVNTSDPCSKSSDILDHFSIKKSISSSTSTATLSELSKTSGFGDPFSELH